mmetsp:Transcript_2522/g.4748  ORF Transcript_2522/g.4748 Transcript_2522/m.4748 type:complete len:116 (-) Transcript_2522:276-623(-)
MHDVLALERAGLSSVALLSDEFQPQALYQGAQVAGGALDTQSLLSLLVWVPHPISDQTPSQMRAKADKCYATVVQGLTQGVDAGDLLNKLASASASASSPPRGEAGGVNADECKS